MKELVVISGKGGTGKTSVTAALATLAADCVLADCDVDAPDLHLVLQPQIRTRTPFSGGSQAHMQADRCTACGACLDLCRFGAILPPEGDGLQGRGAPRIDPIACEGCGVCAWFCPQQAIALEPAINGEWYLSDTHVGPMVHARLGIAEENSGKLVSVIREAARRIAREQHRDLILIDGSPGIGCPVIASITGAHLALVVTEPTLSGLHDLQRVTELTAHFGVETFVCVNKWDLNERITERIEQQAVAAGGHIAGRIRYDRAVTEAQLHARSVVEHNGDNGAAGDIRRLWAELSAIAQNQIRAGG